MKKILQSLRIILLSTAFIASISIAQSQVWFQDLDQDGYGDVNNPVDNTGQCIKPCSMDPRDCNDNDKDINANTVYYFDADGDGYYTATWKFIDHQLLSNGTDPEAHCRQDNRWHLAGQSVNLFVNTYSQFSVNSTITYVPKGLGDCDDMNGAVGGATVWYHDKDKDGYATETYTGACPPNTTEWFYNEQIFSRANNSYYFAIGIGDCDDNDKNINAGTKWFLDLDKDGYASSTKTGGCRP